MRNFKNVLLISGLLSILVSSVSAENVGQNKAENIDRVVAVVNSEIITDSEVTDQMNGLKHEF